MFMRTYKCDKPSSCDQTDKQIMYMIITINLVSGFPTHNVYIIKI